jgi:putative glutathione S-transferase
MPAMSQPSSSVGHGPTGGVAGPPWAFSDPPGPPNPARAPGPARPPAPAGPPWPPSDPPRQPAGRPPWADEPPPGPSHRPTQGEPGWTTGAPPTSSGTFSYPSADSGPGTGSLPAITGGLIRRQGTFTGRISRDGSTEFPAEPSRYQLYASLACPWSQRALIACRLLGLDRVIGLTLTDPVADEHGWAFGDGGDPLTGAQYLADLYRTTDRGYQGPFTIPLIWDLRSRRIVSNDVAQITVMLETEFRPFHRPGAPDLYPAARRRDIESLTTLIFHTVNTGVYKAGLATTQASYDQAVEAVFTTLDALDERLARRRFLLGDMLTEADVRLYPTLARFDAVYYQMFKCNLRRLTDYRHLWGYARDLYTLPGFGETTDLAQIKRHYYQSSEWGHKYPIVPIGPQINWTEPHGRARMHA